MDAASIEMKGGSLSLNVRGVNDDPWKMPAAPSLIVAQS